MTAVAAPIGCLARLVVELAAGMPTAHASNAAKAAWFAKKATVLDLMAEEDPARAAYLRQRAQCAREMAAECAAAGEQ